MITRNSVVTVSIIFFGLLSVSCKKKVPEMTGWVGVPSSSSPVCGDEGSEGRVYTCIADSTIYTCIRSINTLKDNRYINVFTCAPKVFGQTPKTFPAER